MKGVGIVLVAIGISLLLFVLYNIFINHDQIISPLPENKGVRVIFISPSK
jgi:hypothetical protein